MSENTFRVAQRSAGFLRWAEGVRDGGGLTCVRLRWFQGGALVPLCWESRALPPDMPGEEVGGGGSWGCFWKQAGRF